MEAIQVIKQLFNGNHLSPSELEQAKNLVHSLNVELINRGGLDAFNDNTRDKAIKLVDKLVKNGCIKDCFDTDNGQEFEAQDIIQAEIKQLIINPFK